MRIALGFVVCAAACETPLPVAELRTVVVQNLHATLAAVATPPPDGAWRCVEGPPIYRCGGGPHDSLTVRIDSVVANRGTGTAEVHLNAEGRLESHFGPGGVDGFMARWVDTYHWSGTKWKRTGRRINLIT